MKSCDGACIVSCWPDVDHVDVANAYTRAATNDARGEELLQDRQRDRIDERRAGGERGGDERQHDERGARRIPRVKVRTEEAARERDASEIFVEVGIAPQ